MGLIIGGASARDLVLDGHSVSLWVGGSPPEKIWPTSEVHEVSLTGVVGSNVAHPLTTLTIPEGQTWQVRIQGQITEASSSTAYFPFFRIGAVDGQAQGVGPVDVSGTVTSANPSVSLVTVNTGSRTAVSFTGTVTIEK